MFDLCMYERHLTLPVHAVLDTGGTSLSSSAPKPKINFDDLAKHDTNDMQVNR